MNKPTDILGWSSTQWGMSEEEILKLVPDAKRLNPPEEYPVLKMFATVHIPEINIERHKCYIHFVIDEKTGLYMVLIKPITEKPIGYFEHFLELLTEKYGQPTKSTNIDIKETVIWQFPSTIVELGRTDASVLDLLFVSISYQKNVPRDLSLL